MDLFNLDQSKATGICRYCQERSLFTKSACDGCGTRLPWADGVASELGEPCPRCATFNVYTQRSCSKCGELLPWFECMAALFHARHDSEKEQKSLVTTIVLSLIGVSFFLYFLVWTIWARP